MTPTFPGWVAAFAITQAIEVPIYTWALLREEARGRFSLKKALVVAFGASALTHPIVWFVLPPLTDALFAAMAQREMEIVYNDAFRWIVYAGICEGFAFGAEAIYLRALKAPRPALWSFVANFTSASFGLLLSHFTGWP